VPDSWWDDHLEDIEIEDEVARDMAEEVKASEIKVSRAMRHYQTTWDPAVKRFEYREFPKYSANTMVIHKFRPIRNNTKPILFNPTEDFYKIQNELDREVQKKLVDAMLKIKQKHDIRTTCGS
jgi:hypothetical protein